MAQRPSSCNTGPKEQGSPSAAGSRSQAGGGVLPVSRQSTCTGNVARSSRLIKTGGGLSGASHRKVAGRNRDEPAPHRTNDDCSRTLFSWAVFQVTSVGQCSEFPGSSLVARGGSTDRLASQGPERRASRPAMWSGVFASFSVLRKTACGRFAFQESRGPADVLLGRGPAQPCEEAATVLSSRIRSGCWRRLLLCRLPKPTAPPSHKLLSWGPTRFHHMLHAGGRRWPTTVAAETALRDVSGTAFLPTSGLDKSSVPYAGGERGREMQRKWNYPPSEYDLATPRGD